MALDRQTVIEKYRRGIQNGGQNYTAGVRGQGQVWQDRASSDEAERAWEAGVIAAANARRRQNAVRAVTAASWEEAAATVGAQNYAQSAQKAAERYEAQVDEVIAAGNAARSAAQALPGDNITQRLAKAQAAAIAIHRHWARQRNEQPEV